MKYLMALILLFPVQAFAACHAVSVAGSGTNSGADWSNTMANLPATPVRGDTYYMADGTGYVGPTNYPAASGTTQIILRKARDTGFGDGDHGQSCGLTTGWNGATMGQGQAIFTTNPGISFNTTTPASYVTLSGGGRTTLSTGYGIKLDTSACNTNCYTVMLGYNAGTKANNITVEYVEMNQSNPSGGTNFQQDYGVYAYCNDQTSHASGCHDYTFQYNYHHNSACDFFFTRNVTNLTVQYSYLFENNGGVACHGQNWEDNNSVNMIWRYNVFDESRGTAVLVVLDDGAFTLTTDGFYVYGNVFYDHSGGAGWTANGTVACINPGITCNNMEVFNNTFSGQQNTGAGAGANQVGSYVGDSAVCTGTCIFENNLFYNVTTSGGGAVTLVNSLATEDYNSVILSGATSPFVNTHDILDNTNVNHFTNLGATPPAPYDFTLTLDDTTDYTGGISLASPYNQSCGQLACTSLTTRGADGTWERGAYEYVSGAAPSVPTQPEIIILGKLLKPQTSSLAATASTISGTANANDMIPFQPVAH